MKRSEIPDESREILRRAVHAGFGETPRSEGLVDILCEVAAVSGLEEALSTLAKAQEEVDRVEAEAGGQRPS
ncbi:MAG TPA: hypothetical protein VIA62_16840 [Thermoanaerobaculia bacterium]|jgi:hypothetical protein|nr:hypothetical protein [Thermoanaerobaculia bacterium]